MKITRKELDAIAWMLDDLLGSYCSCENTPNRENGYLGHDRECAIHQHRDKFRTLGKLLERNQVDVNHEPHLPGK